MAGDAGEQPRFTLTDDGDVLRLAWAAGVTIEASDVRETMAAVTAASPHGKRPLLVSIGLVDAISLEARHLLIEDTCSLRTGVVGVDEVGRVLTAFNYRSVTPSRFFTDESDAIAWLTGRADAGDTTSRASEEANPFCAQLEGGVAVVRWEHGVSVSTAAAEALVAGVAALAPGERPPMLALNNSMVSLTPGAFEVFAHRLSVSALAIVGAEGDSVIAAYYKQKHKPPYPTRFFGTAAEGRTWLLQGRARPGPQDSWPVRPPGR